MSFPVLCASCGYDLVGIDSPICPECATPRVVQPASGFVAQPWPCIRCGYSLLGAPHTGSCPECGTGVSRSLDPSLLRMQPARSLKTLQTGAMLTTLGIVVPVLGPCLGSTLLGFAGLHGVATLLLLNTLGWLLLLLGVWRITKPLGAEDTPARTMALLPLLFRLSTAIAAACSTAIVVFMYSITPGWPGGQVAPSIPGVVLAIRIATVSTLGLSAITGLLHARSIMRRGVRRGKRGGASAISALVVILVAGALTTAAIAFGGIAFLSNPGPQGAYVTIATVVSLGAGLAWFTAYISLIGVSERLRLLVRRERIIGERARAVAPAERTLPSEIPA